MYALNLHKIIRYFILVSFLLYAFNKGYAADIYQVTFPDDITIIRSTQSSQYVISDDTPKVTQFTQARHVTQATSPLSIKFSQKPQLIAEAEPKGIVEPKNNSDKPILSVHFDINSALLKGGERNKLKGAVQSLKTSGPLAIIGYTCDLGSKTYNDRLSLARAKAVENFLTANGVLRDNVSIEGKGKCCYTDPTRRSVNRRAEIYNK